MSKKAKAFIKFVGTTKYFILAILIALSLSYVYFFQGGNQNWYIILASIGAIYMAINMGANDIANNMGPAVGSKALTLGKALFIAVIFETAGSVMAGGDVTQTIKKEIIDTSSLQTREVIDAMLATLIGGAIWVNLATYLKTPVSITNSVVGGLIGAGLIASGPKIVMWAKVGSIAVSWVISLVLGGVISVAIYQSIRWTIINTKDKGISAKNWLPIYIGIITFVFSLYLLLKGLNPLVTSYKTLANIITPTNSIIAGFIFAICAFVFMKVSYSRKNKGYFEDNRKFVNKLFNVPLIVAAALLSFAHGSNDVANAIGPFTAVYEAINNIDHAVVPFWILLFGAVSLSAGLAVFGERLIKTVGSDITKIDQIRAFCVALSATITVLIASTMGLPVSTTQISLGAIFGIGLYRKALSIKKGQAKDTINLAMMKGILLSWLVTLPISGGISAAIYWILVKF